MTNPETLKSQPEEETEVEAPEPRDIQELAQIFSILKNSDVSAEDMQRMLDEQETISKEYEAQAKGNWYMYAEVSEAPESVQKEIETLMQDIGPLPQDEHEASLHIRNYLSEHFTYDISSFTLQDVVENKKGNCLGLALLFGAVMKENGFEPRYEMLIHPEEKRNREKEFFTALRENSTGETWNYDDPPLPDAQAEEPQFLFAALEHPVLSIDGRRFETTRLDPDDLKEDPDWAPEHAESARPVTYEQVASTVIIDRLKHEFAKETFTPDKEDYAAIKTQFEKAILKWPDNREAWYDLAAVAEAFDDKQLHDLAKHRYMNYEADDSRFYAAMYDLLKDEVYLDLALEKYPEQPHLYVEKHVVKENNVREARFDFAVAAFAVANSSIWNLKTFYQIHQNDMERLYGKQRVKKLFTKMHLKTGKPSKLKEVASEEHQ